MTIIKINATRAIIVNDATYALAKWEKRTRTLPDKSKEVYHDWGEYMWPSSLDSAIDMLAQEFVSNLNITVSMAEFKEKWNEMLNLIYIAINGEKTRILSKGYNG